MSDVERQALIIDSPALVGAAAGVPPRHRDEANRLRLLAEHLVALTESGWDLAALAGVRDRAGAPTAMVGWWGSAVALHALLDGLRATRPTAAATTGSIRPFPT